jgi:hypothetical protein
MNTFAGTLAAMWLCVCWVSCAFHTPRYDVSSKSQYDISLKEVVTPSQVKERFGEQRIVRADSDDIQRYVFENDMIRIFWIPTEISLAFTLENKTDDSLKIMWGDAAYIDGEGVTGRVTHGGVRYDDFYYTGWPLGQQPSVILSKGRVSDMVLPLLNTHAGGGEMAGTGYVTALLPGDAKSNVGKTIQVLLPLKMEATVVEYTFVFNIDGIMTGK